VNSWEVRGIYWMVTRRIEWSGGVRTKVSSARSVVDSEGRCTLWTSDCTPVARANRYRDGTDWLEAGC
jgi:hypothetical protein